MFELYKITDKVGGENGFLLIKKIHRFPKQGNLGGHSMELVGNQLETGEKKQFFIQQVVTL